MYYVWALAFFSDTLRFFGQDDNLNVYAIVPDRDFVTCHELFETTFCSFE